MIPNKDLKESLRVYPGDALTPLDFGRLFGNEAPVEIDLGCGKGRFLLARSGEHPSINFFGIERMLQRIRRVDRKAVRLGRKNVRLFRMEAYYAVSYLIPPESVQAYYILFPDPWPKPKHLDQRLFNPAFMNAIHRTIRPNGLLHFTTDHLPYFDDVSTLLRADTRFEEVPAFIPAEHEQTDFERMYIDTKPIGRASFRKRS